MPSAFAQSQALNGQIEGTISDQTGAAVPNAAITVTNIETGATRTVTTDESGVYRFPLLPLGTYRITAEAANFKKFVREGITLATGQTATIDIEFANRRDKEVVTVSADTSIADAGKTDLGRVMNTREVQNLPLDHAQSSATSGFCKPMSTGRPKRGFAVSESSTPTVICGGSIFCSTATPTRRATAARFGLCFFPKLMSARSSCDERFCGGIWQHAGIDHEYRYAVGNEQDSAARSVIVFAVRRFIRARSFFRRPICRTTSADIFTATVGGADHQGPLAFLFRLTNTANATIKPCRAAFDHYSGKPDATYRRRFARVDLSARDSYFGNRIVLYFSHRPAIKR